MLYWICPLMNLSNFSLLVHVEGVVLNLIHIRLFFIWIWIYIWMMRMVLWWLSEIISLIWFIMRIIFISIHYFLSTIFIIFRLFGKMLFYFMGLIKILASDLCNVLKKWVWRFDFYVILLFCWLFKYLLLLLLLILRTRVNFFWNPCLILTFTFYNLFISGFNVVWPASLWHSSRSSARRYVIYLFM